MKNTQRNAPAAPQLHPIIVEMWRRLADWADAQEEMRLAAQKSSK